ncbi:CYTH domain-containing protein [Marinomonas sp. A79]|uniref:CYTH domain-containing protein n=1 Tax=Marinomonas vulgaris TaxID=2823372 RepID=A0ABS5HCR9_9GAMM|nr:CYTH domain-containing protein [Marinomonas vulgaris]MBR7889450.1 CYTH domain-containing protein [Marinomonas vulgaris]
MAIELELKLMIQPEYLASAGAFLDNICGQSTADDHARQPTLSLMNAYFDTEDANLMHGGVAMRIRAVNGKFIQTVKTRGSSRIGMHARGEWEWLVPSDQLDLSLLNEVPLPEALQDKAWQANLIEVYRTDFERQVWNISAANAKMEVVCDHGLVTSPYGEDRICEVELELKSGDEMGLYQFAMQLAERVPVQVSVVSKAQKGVRLKYGHIDFPDKPESSAEALLLAAYWYEVWLVYWEAMHFMQDDVLSQPLRHSMAKLKGYLPEEIASKLATLDDEVALVVASENEDVLSQLAGMKQVGIVMLAVGLWLNNKNL